MNFLLPIAALGLLTLPVILILHLLRNRRQQLPIPSLELWRGLQQKKHGALPRSIPLSLMLMLQLLMATALTLALAQPVFSFLLDQPRQFIFILDTTTSMAAEDSPGQPRRFDAARQVIREQLETLSDQDAFAVIGLNARPEILLSGTAGQVIQALPDLDNFTPGATGLNLQAALTLANGMVDANRQNQIIVLTDAAYPVEAAALPPILAPLEWQILASPPPGLTGSPNQALLNVSARTLPDGRHRLFARVINYSDRTVARTVRVLAGESLFDETVVQLEAQGETARVWTLPASAETATVEIVEADGLPLDNRAELFLRDAARYRVLLVSDTPETLTRALKAQPGVELTLDTAAAREHSSNNFDLTVFEGMGLSTNLTTWPQGNVWVVSPPLGHPLLLAQNYIRNLRPDPASASTLLAGVDLSGVYFNRVHQLTLPTWADVDLTTAANPQAPASNLATGQPLIFHGSVGNSRLVVWAFDLAASNLPARLALPLLTANTLQTLLSPTPQSVVPVGEHVPISGNFNVELPGGRRLFSTLEEEREGGVFTRTEQPGLYKIYNNQNNLVAGFAAHAGSALESNLAVQFQPASPTLNPLREPTSPTVNTLPPQTEYYEFWPWLAGLVLVVVVVEGWLAWRK